MALTRYTFPRSHRLRTRREFSRVFDGGVRQSRGPLTVHAIPNDLAHPRLGISIGRRFGKAALRNRVKRLLRESFRMHQHDLPRGYDLVITVRGHEPMILAEYQKLMTALMLKVHEAWQQRRQPREAEDQPRSDG